MKSRSRKYLTERKNISRAHNLISRLIHHTIEVSKPIPRYPKGSVESAGVAMIGENGSEQTINQLKMQSKSLKDYCRELEGKPWAHSDGRTLIAENVEVVKNENGDNMFRITLTDPDE